MVFGIRLSRKGQIDQIESCHKTSEDRHAVFQVVLDDKIDMVATDHAPHTLKNKVQLYIKTTTDAQLYQHGLMVV
jgi:dihydroorotase